jgi:hypothetical protein
MFWIRMKHYSLYGIFNYNCECLGWKSTGRKNQNCLTWAELHVFKGFVELFSLPNVELKRIHVKE